MTPSPLLTGFARSILPLAPAPAANRSPAGNLSRVPAPGMDGHRRADRAAKLSSNSSAALHAHAGVSKESRPGTPSPKASAPASRFAHWAGLGTVPSVPSLAESGQFANADEAARFVLNAGTRLRGMQAARAAASGRPLPRAAAPDMDTAEGVAAFVLAAGRNARGQR